MLTIYNIKKNIIDIVTYLILYNYPIIPHRPTGSSGFYMPELEAMLKLLFITIIAI